MVNPTPGQRPSWVSDELFPFESRFHEVDGHTIHYIDEGDGPLLLLYHGNPTWSFLYRDIISGCEIHSVASHSITRALAYRPLPRDTDSRRLSTPTSPRNWFRLLTFGKSSPWCRTGVVPSV